MAEPIPEIFGEGTPSRQHVARLRVVPDQVLFEKLKPFYASSDTVRRIGTNAVKLCSIKHTQIDQYAFRPFGNGELGMSEVDRIDHDLRQLNGSERRMVMTDHLTFGRLKNGGIAIELAVELNPAIAEILHGTGFIAKDNNSLDVNIKLVMGQHASGVVMQKAARELKSLLDNQAYPRAGTDAVGLIIDR